MCVCVCDRCVCVSEVREREVRERDRKDRTYRDRCARARAGTEEEIVGRYESLVSGLMAKGVGDKHLLHGLLAEDVDGTKQY